MFPEDAVPPIAGSTAVATFGCSAAREMLQLEAGVI
jgi:hypothetical protein